MKDIKKILSEQESNVDWTQHIADMVAEGLEKWRWDFKKGMRDWDGEPVDIKSVKKSGKGWVVKFDMYEHPYEVVIKKL